MSDKLFRIDQVKQATGLSQSTIYDWMQRGEFPQPVKLGSRMVAWRESDLDAWTNSLKPREGTDTCQVDRTAEGPDEGQKPQVAA